MGTCHSIWLSKALIGLMPGTQKVVFQMKPVEGTIDFGNSTFHLHCRRDIPSTQKWGGHTAGGWGDRARAVQTASRTARCLTEEQGELLPARKAQKTSLWEKARQC